MINLPLIADTLAVRAVIYSDTRGGYIDNVPGTFTRLPTDIGIHYAGYATGCRRHSGERPVLRRHATAYGVPPAPHRSTTTAWSARAINPVTYQGIRAERAVQDQRRLECAAGADVPGHGFAGRVLRDAQSSAGEVLPRRSLDAAVHPTYNKDRFENTALDASTASIGDLKARVLRQLHGSQHRPGGRLHELRARRRTPTTISASARRGAHAPPAKCYSPVRFLAEDRHGHPRQQEIRLSTPDDWRLRGIVGVFWEDYKHRREHRLDVQEPCRLARRTGTRTPAA